MAFEYDAVIFLLIILQWPQRGEKGTANTAAVDNNRRRMVQV